MGNTHIVCKCTNNLIKNLDKSTFNLKINREYSFYHLKLYKKL